MGTSLDAPNDRMSDTVFPPPGVGGLRLIGDVHGEIELLASRLDEADRMGLAVLLLGDLVDRGPDSVAVVRLVLARAEAGMLDMVPGNHDDKLWRHVAGRPVDTDGEIGQTLAAFANAFDGQALLRRFAAFVGTRPLWRRVGDLFCVHAGFAPAMLAEKSPPTLRDTPARLRPLRHTALYGAGPMIGGRVMRSYDWIDTIPNGLVVVIGHDIVSRQTIVMREGRAGGRLIHLDTGAATGGILSHLDIDMPSQTGKKA
ncbi:Calcineurin-like phosphoesterase [Arboricoccus pini]|uniref:Calcineurin-like phosphoesterase n=1 Tax=Arboricoccus pini TaxID=1963835 RepID=A0A212RWQ0_9PROT|nr:metallophosphoesterase [Arboricoccus pini]SNB77204.1 Calcineurin-like phosphoesterase [Arboricoccus pini]